MKKSELKNVLRPIVEELINEIVEEKVREVVNESLMESDVISAIVSGATKASMEMLIENMEMPSSVQPIQERSAPMPSSRARGRQSKPDWMEQHREFLVARREEGPKPLPENSQKTLSKIEEKLGANVFNDPELMERARTISSGGPKTGLTGTAGELMGGHMSHLDPTNSGGVDISFLPKFK